MVLFVALDLSLASTALCALNAHRKVVKEAKVDSEPEALIAVPRELPGKVVVVGLEAGPLLQWLRPHMSPAGFTVVPPETRQGKGVLKAIPIKTGRRDAEGIARIPRMGGFRPVHCKWVSAQEMRAVLNTRKSLRQALMNIGFSQRGVLRCFGLGMGAVTKVRLKARVREPVDGNLMPERAAAAVPRAREELRKELARLEKPLRDLARTDPACGLMMTMPGVGAVVALTMRTAVDDPERFHASKDIGPWASLTPRRSQSGERDVIGQITRAGDAALRTTPHQTANAMLCRSAPRSRWRGGPVSHCIACGATGRNSASPKRKRWRRHHGLRDGGKDLTQGKENSTIFRTGGTGEAPGPWLAGVPTRTRFPMMPPGGLPSGPVPRTQFGLALGNRA